MSYLAERARALRDRLRRTHSAEGAQRASSVSPHAGDPGRLSAREIEVLRLLAGGRTAREIAEELVLSVHTVNNHVASICAKLGARRRADAVALAARHGLL